jgi:hypothetical protein
MTLVGELWAFVVLGGVLFFAGVVLALMVCSIIATRKGCL